MRRNQEGVFMQIINEQAVSDLLGNYPRDRRHALAAMQDMQRQFGYVPREGLGALAEHMRCPLSVVYSMATFYKALSLKPKGKHIIKVCDGAACHVRGSSILVDAIKRELGISPGEVTDDREFSMELVNCLGTCALAPVMVVDDEYYSKVKPEMLPGLFDAILFNA